MNCQEARAALHKGPYGVTRAEYSAMVTHIDDCWNCGRWVRFELWWGGVISGKARMTPEHRRRMQELNAPDPEVS